MGLGADGSRGAWHHPNDTFVAALLALGRRGGCWVRVHGNGIRGDRRNALVRCASRPGYGSIDRCICQRSSTFWWLFGSFAVCGLSTTGLVQTHFISAAHDHGMTGATAGGYLAFIGGFDVIGTIASGWLTDRWDPRKLLLIYYAFRGMSLFVLDPALTTRGGGLFGFIAFYGLDWVATVPPTIAICIQAFGHRRGPLVYGWVFVGHQLGGAIAAFGAGYLRDRTGSFRLSFSIAGAACLVAAAGVMRIRGSAPVMRGTNELAGAVHKVIGIDQDPNQFARRD